MPRFDYESLRGFEGKTVRLISTEGEVMRASIQNVLRDGDMLVTVIETNQIERRVALGWQPSHREWAIPFAYIASIEEVKEPPAA